MSQKGKAKKAQRERSKAEEPDNISRLTKTILRREHMGYPDHDFLGDKEELVRNVREPFRSRVLNGGT